MVSVYSIAGTPVAVPFNLKPGAVNIGTWNTELISGFDREMFKPVFLPNAINRHPNSGRFYFSDLIKLLGFQIPVLAGEHGQYGHFEKERTVNALVVSGAGYQGAGGAGAPITFRLDPTTVYTDPTFNIKSSYARLRQIVHFQIGDTNVVNGWITNISNAPAGTQEITVEPDDSTVNLLALLGGAGAGAGATVGIISNAYAEGSRQGQTLTPRWATYKNQLQIIKDDDSRTGSSMVRNYQLQDFPFEFDGKKMNAFELVGTEDAERRLKIARDGAVCFGTLNDNFFETDSTVVEPNLTGIQVRTTQGLYPFVFQNGNTIPYTTGAFAIGDVDALNDTLDAEAAPYNYVWAYGSPFGQQIREVLKNYVKDDTNNQYVKGEIYGNIMDSDYQEGLAVQVGFQSLSLMPSSRKFHFKNVTSFDDPEMLGGSSYTYKDMYLLMPLGTFKNMASQAKLTEQFGTEYNGTEMPYWGYVYAQKGSYIREVEMFQTGSAGQVLVKKPTDDFDVQRVHFRGEFGAWAGAANLFVVGYPN